ncbi:MAG: sensor histidine kinase [Leadbetterella sp.]|nr:sensor histidine kinase [Leadbetterella sp.]
MTLRLLFFLVCITISPSFAQNKPKTVEERKEWANSVHRKAILRNDSMLLAEAYYLYGKIEMTIPNNYLKAKLWFLKSLAIAEKRSPNFEEFRLYLNLARNELLLKNYHDAFKYYQKGVHTAEATKIGDSIAEAYWALAIFFSDNLNIYPGLDNSLVLNPYINKDSADYYMMKAEKYAQKNGRSRYIPTLVKLHRGYASTDSLERVVRELTPRETKNTVKTTALLILALRYIETGNLEKARMRLEDAEKANQLIFFSPQLHRNILLTYIRYYEASGEFQKAFTLLKEIREKDYTLLVRERNGEISDLKKGFETGQEALAKEVIEMELKLQQEKSRLQDRILLFGLLFILFLGATVVLLYILNRKNRQISRQNALLVKEQNHRFNNNLQAVSDLLTLKSEELDIHGAKTVFGESRLLLQSIATLQKKLYSGDKLVSVEPAQMIPEVVKNGLNAFNLAHVKTEYDLSPAEIHAEDALLLNLVITELTTNACKHALKNTPDPGVRVRMNVSGDHFHFTFRDNGTAPFETSGRSFGLYLVDLLVKQMQGTYRFYFDQGTVFEMHAKIKILHENTHR